MSSAREYQLVRRPVGTPTPDDFRIITRELGTLGPSQVRVRNLFLSVDPYMRGRMSDAKSYAAPYELDAPMSGGAVGRVDESHHPDFKAGDLVLSMHGWRDGFVSDGAGLVR